MIVKDNTSSCLYPFRYESDMRAPVLNWLRNRGLHAELEVQMPWGTADIVALRPNKGQVSKRIQYGQLKKLGNISRFRVLEMVPDVDTGKSVTLRTLAKRVAEGCSGDLDLLNHLHALERDSFIQQPKRGHFQKLNGWQPLQEILLSIELKLDRFRDALSQARQNMAAVNESYVAFPSKVAERIACSKRGNELRREGIGLLSVGDSGCHRIITAKTNRNVSLPIIESNLVERFWETMIKDS